MCWFSFLWFSCVSFFVVFCGPDVDAMNVCQSVLHQVPDEHSSVSMPSVLVKHASQSLSSHSNSLPFLSGQEHLLPLREGCRGNIKEVLRRGGGGRGDKLMTPVDTFPQICTLTLTPRTSSAKQRKKHQETVFICY